MMIRVNKMKLQVVKLYPIFLDSVISTELHCDVSPKGSLDEGVFQFDLILCFSLVADSAMLKNPQFLTPFSSFSLQLRVIRCFGVGSSFLGSGTTLNNSKWNTWVKYFTKAYLQVPEAFAPTGSSMVTVALALSGSGWRTILS